MDKSKDNIKFSWRTLPFLVTIMLAGMLFCQDAEAQVVTDTLQANKAVLDLTEADTSYFQSGYDEWNLVESVLKNNKAAVLMLLNRGADPNAKAEGGMTALMYAAESGDTTLVKLLALNGADLDATLPEGTTPLIIAVLNAHFPVVHFLLDKGAEPDHQDDYKGSALLYAAATNAYQIADLLLFYGASDTIRDRDGNTPLMTAVYFGNLECADVLLQNGLSPDATDYQGNTPLMVAAQQGNQDMLKLLLERGADVEAQNKSKYTALAHAIQYQQDTIVRILADSGANVNYSIKPNRNLYDLARLQDHKPTLKVLKEKGASASPGPDFSEYRITWGNSLRNNQHLMQARFSLVDRKYKFFLETGVDFRLGYPRVQVQIEDQLIHQYREYRWAWAHGFGKDFKFLHDRENKEYGAYGAVYGLLSMPSYRGVNSSPTANYSVALCAGLYLKGKWVGMKAGVDRYTFGTLLEEPWKMNISLFVNIVKHKTQNVYKEINY